MDTFLEIVKYVLPSLVVMLTAFTLIRQFLENEQRIREDRRKGDIDNLVVPLRLQAYERMILFLERINPASLIMRISQPDMDASQLHAAMVRTIREEFEHNLSQQLYISDNAWQHVKNAREEMVRLINITASQIDQNAGSHELAGAVFDAVLKEKGLYLEKALDYVKKEFRELCEP